MELLLEIKTDRVIFHLRRRPGAEPEPLGSTRRSLGKAIIRPRRAGLDIHRVYRAQVPEGARALVEIEEGPRLFEETPYSVYLEGQIRQGESNTRYRVRLLHRDPILADLASEQDESIQYGTINFRSQVGMSTFTVLVDDQPEFDLDVEVFPTKLDYGEDYKDMLVEVQEILTGLALEYLRATFQSGQMARVPQPTHLEWITLLRHVIDDLERALRYVARHPVRGLTRQSSEPVRAEAVRHPDSTVRAAIRRGSGKGPAVTLKSGLPVRTHVVDRRPRSTLDTPEHRFLATQLDAISRRLAALQIQVAALSRSDSEDEPTLRRQAALRELATLGRRIQRLRTLEPITAVSGPPPAGFVSMQLLGAPGYREAYRALLVLSLGLRIEGGPMQLSVKDLSLLYEYWCFLALLRLVSEITGQPIPAKHLLAIRDYGLRVLLKKGRETRIPFATSQDRTVTVRYNPRFQAKPVLIPQQPDIVLTFTDPHWPELHLIVDAKYRVDNSKKYREQYGTAGPPQEALNVLHRYRDAILEVDRNRAPNNQASGPITRDPGDVPKRTVVQAAAAFPFRDGDRSSRSGICFEDGELWRALETIGIGAVPMLPGSLEYARRWLEQALRAGGWSLADRVLPHRATERAEEWRRAASIAVHVGVLRGEDPDGHWQWIREQGLYYVPLTQTHRSRFTVSYVAFYMPTQLRKPGAVTHVAPIVSIDVQRRSQIPTPWPPSHRRGADDPLCVVYRLGPIEKLPNAIENVADLSLGRRPQRFSTPRWTSLLALRRASTLPELLLETHMEWRLYEALQAAGIQFTVTYSNPVVDKNTGEAYGHAKFTTGNGTCIQNCGPAGFRVWKPGEEQRYFATVEGVVNTLIK